MLDGALALPATLFTIGAVLVVMEFSTVLLCVANDYKAFNYALRIADVDAARQLDLETLWASAQRPTPVFGPNNTVLPPREPPLHLSSGILSSRVVVSPRLDALLRASFEEMIDWHLAVDTSDSFVLLLLFVSTVYCALFLNTTHLLRTEDMLDKVVASPPRGDVLLLDVVFWALFASDFACLQKLANLVCVDALIAWTALVYAVLMFVLAQVDAPPPAVGVGVGVVWNVHFVTVLAASGMPLLPGLAMVSLHLVAVGLVFVHRTSPPVTHAKFVNTRFWAAVGGGSLVFMTYMSAVVYAPPPRRVWVG